MGGWLGVVWCMCMYAGQVETTHRMGYKGGLPPDTPLPCDGITKSTTTHTTVDDQPLTTWQPQGNDGMNKDQRLVDK